MKISKKSSYFGSRQNNLRFFCGSKGRSEKMGSVFVVGKGQNRPTAFFIHQCSGAHSGKFWRIITRQLFAIYSTPEGVTRDPTDWETQTSFEKFNYLVLGQKRWNSKSLSCMKIKQQWHFCKNIPASANQLRKKKRYSISTNEEPTRKINREENIWRSPYIESSETRFLSSGVVNVQIYIVNLIVFLMCAILSKYVYKNL